MRDRNAIAEQLNEAKRSHGRFLALYAMQCLWDRGVRRLEQALGLVRIPNAAGESKDVAPRNRD